MSRWVFTALLCAFLLGIALAGAAQERVLYNGKIFTAEPPEYWEVVHMEGSKIGFKQVAAQRIAELATPLRFDPRTGIRLFK